MSCRLKVYRKSNNIFRYSYLYLQKLAQQHTEATKCKPNMFFTNNISYKTKENLSLVRFYQKKHKKMTQKTANIFAFSITMQ